MNKRTSVLWATCLSLACSIAFVAEGAAFSAPLTADEADEIAVEAYIYAYPLVFMDVTREVITNVPRPVPYGYSPMNQFGHKRTFPDASFTEAPRPNADTLYSSLWFDVTKEPLVIHIPDSGGRYYLLQMVDMWGDTFASPGKRTTGTGPQTYAITGPDWEGTLPEDVEMRRSPTNIGWIVGRTQTNGKKDYENVHAFQDGFVSMPLSAWGTDFTWPEAKTNPDLQKARQIHKIAKMDGASFFARFSEVVKNNPPHANDYPILARMRRIGLEPGKPFRLADQPAIVQDALIKAPQRALEIIQADYPKQGKVVNNWRIRSGFIGTYGTAYWLRAAVARGGTVGNVAEDAAYLKTYKDAKGEPFTSDRKYALHFAKGELPPVRAFWSLTLYNEKNVFADNPLDRYAIGDRDELEFNDDGSLTLYIQRESPGKDKESNWLPTPKEGAFSVTLRNYWPKPEVRRGIWSPPAIKRVE